MKFLIFVILIITLLTVDQPQINQMRVYLATLIGQAAESEYSRGKVSKRIYDEISTQFDSFKPNEEDYVKEITKSSRELMAFYGTYCQNGEFNPKISAYNLRFVCSKVDEQFTDLENEIIRQRK
ncbi:hypothetical protein [Psychrosphaera aestuarii]|uniref:hypothetical protein n=1 Tax=Psychrosphaera aestuarii TaxID=1266052 RepID=UPI001B32987A|nr:hypothetical protein [Psychrosphaera aestuarii]